MRNTEIAELMHKEGTMYNWATKVNNRVELSSEEKEISEVVDAWSKDIGDKGIDNGNELAEYIKKVVEPEVKNTDDGIISQIFDIGTIGEFDKKAYNVLPKNTLKVYDAVRGGNVPKSYIDPSVFTPIKESLQTETEIKYADLRRNGFRSVAQLTIFAEEALQNEKYFRIFNAIDNALTTGSENDISAGGSALTPASMDALATYLSDRSNSNPLMIGLTKYTNNIAKMSGYDTFLSDEMKNKFNKFGKLDLYNGVRIQGISSARKTADGKTLIPDKRILGIADKIGELDMRGELRVLETLNNNEEKVELKFAGLDFDYAIYHLDKIARITLG